MTYLTVSGESWLLLCRQTSTQSLRLETTELQSLPVGQLCVHGYRVDPSSWGHSSIVSRLSSLTGGSPGSRGGCSCLWARVHGSCPPCGQPHQPLGTPTASAGPSRSLALWPQPWELCPPPTPGALSPPGFLQESLLLVLGCVQMSPDCEPPRGETLGQQHCLLRASGEGKRKQGQMPGVGRGVHQGVLRRDCGDTGKGWRWALGPSSPPRVHQRGFSARSLVSCWSRLTWEAPELQVWVPAGL